MNGLQFSANFLTNKAAAIFIVNSQLVPFHYAAEVLSLRIVDAIPAEFPKPQLD